MHLILTHRFQNTLQCGQQSRGQLILWKERYQADVVEVDDQEGGAQLLMLQQTRHLYEQVHRLVPHPPHVVVQLPVLHGGNCFLVRCRCLEDLLECQYQCSSMLECQLAGETHAACMPALQRSAALLDTEGLDRPTW